MPNRKIIANLHATSHTPDRWAQLEKMIPNKTLIIFILCISNFVYSQNLSDKISDSVCTCLSSSQNYTMQSIESCFTSSLDKFDDELRSLKATTINKSIDDNELAFNFAEKLFSDIILKLQDDCDYLYEHIVKIREFSIQDYKINNPTSIIDKITDSIKTNPEIRHFKNRALYYFTSNKADEAKKDCLKCLEIDSSSIPCTYLLGWIEEKNLNYSRAIELYKKLENQGLPFMQLYVTRLQRLTKK